MLAHLESSLENYAKEALLYQAVAESLDITPTQEQLDAYSDYKDTYGQNYCTMVALMDAVTSTLTSGAVVSCFDPHKRKSLPMAGIFFCSSFR